MEKFKCMGRFVKILGVAEAAEVGPAIGLFFYIYIYIELNEILWDG